MGRVWRSAWGKSGLHLFCLFTANLDCLALWFTKATTVLCINIAVAFLAGSRIGAANKLVLQFGLMAITYTSLILGAIATDRKQTKLKLRKLYQQVQTLNLGLERQAYS